MIPPEPAARLLSPDDRQSLLNFVTWALGDWRLTPWEESFLSGRHQDLYAKAAWQTDKQEVKIREIKDKLGYDQGEVPPPPESDGEEDYDYRDGRPDERDGVVDQFEDDVLVEYLADA